MLVVRKEETVMVILTSKAVYEIDAVDSRKLHRRIDLSEVHQVATVLEQSMKIRMLLLGPLVGAAATTGVKVKVEGWGAGDSMGSYEKTVDYVAQSEQALADWLLVATHTVTLFWQKLFEGVCGLSPPPSL